MVLFNDQAIGESFELSRLCMVGAIEFLDVPSQSRSRERGTRAMDGGLFSNNASFDLRRAKTRAESQSNKSTI